YAAVEISHFYFLPSLLQYIENKFESEEASHVNSIMSAASNVGRLATAFISLRLPANVILAYHYTIIVGSLVLLYLGHSSHRLIYAGTVTIGYGFSAMWPAILDLTEGKLRLSPRITATYSFLVGLSALSMPLLLNRY